MRAKPSRLPELLRTVVFLLVLALALHTVAGVLRSKQYAQFSAALYQEPENSMDVLLMGSSHMLTGVSPLLLWEDYGIVSNSLAQNGQVIPVTYYHLQEALRTQKPRLVVLDVYKAMQDSLIDTKASLHYTLDNMRFGLPKIRAALELAPEEDRAEYLLDLIAYHDRWKELTTEDFQPLDLSEKGGETLFYTTPLPDFHPLPETETAEPAPSAITYMEKIVDLCREEGIELLFVSLPFATPEDDDMDRQQRVNGIASYAGEWGVPYVNMMHLTEELGFDYAADMADLYHANRYGMEKITAWLGAYLTEHYDLPDRRGEDACEGWDAAVADYHAFLDAQEQT